MILIYSIIFFLIGSIPFSYLIGRLANIDIREWGDHNPGATNAYLAGGIKLALPSLILDFSKGAFPIYLYTNGLTNINLALIPISIAPILGHAFSPFLNFKGGKAIAVTMGVWTGLLNFQAPIIIGSSHLFQKYIIGVNKNCWRITSSILLYSIYILIMGHNLILFIIAIINAIIIAIKHRDEF